MTLGEPDWPREFQLGLETLESATDENPFMVAAVELLKEAGTLTSLAVSLHPIQRETRDRAILSALMARLVKLTVEMLAQTTSHHGEAQMGTTRMVIETVANLRYLADDPGDGSRFDAYVKHSLIAEREFLRNVDKNIAERGSDLPIERRIRSSIERTAKAAKVDLDSLPSRVETGWPSAEKRLALLDPRLYDAFRMGSNALHGSWSDLFLNHLVEEENGSFSPDLDHSTPRPQPVIATAALLCLAIRTYIEREAPHAKDEFSPRLDSVEERLASLDSMHEQLVVRERARQVKER